MADNVTTVVATDEIGGAMYQRVKPCWGADGSANDTSAAAPMPVNPVPVTSGGLSVSRLVAAGSTNATVAKASAGQLYGYQIGNSNAAARYVKLYNKASAPTVGSDTPFMTIFVPAGGSVQLEIPHGLDMTTGIAFATTTGSADADTGAVTAGDLLINLFYK